MSDLAHYLGASLLALLPTLQAAPGLASPVERAQRVTSNRPEPTPAQAILDRASHLDVSKIPLAEALRLLSERTDVPFAFSPTFIPEDQQVTCRCEALSLSHALDRLLAGNSLTYRIVGRHVLIERSPASPVPATTPAPSPSVSRRIASTVVAKPVERTRDDRRVGTITGRVIDDQTLQPIATAQVFIDALGIGGLTGIDGKFQLDDVPAGTKTVLVRRIGYREASAELTVVGGRTASVDFGLGREALALDEIVVTGTPGGTQRRAIGNVVAGLDAANLERVSPIVNVEQLLGQRMPGVMVMPGSGSIGRDAGPIRIRGSSSTSLPNDPIVYIDGIRTNSDRPYQSTNEAGSRLNDLNPSDIERIEVIKGPAAATLYGTEASNGVIQIITKRGVGGSPMFDMSIELGATWLADAAEKASVNYGTNPFTGELISENLVLKEEERFGEPLFQSGPIQKLNASARGGTDIIRYFASVNHSYREGIVDWNWDEKTTGRLNLGITLNSFASVDLNGSFVDGANRSDGGLWADLIWGNPVKSIDSGGLEDPRRGWQAQTPEVMRDFREDVADVDRRIASLELNFAPRNWFNHRLVGGIDVAHATRTVFTQKDLEYKWYGNSSVTGRKSLDLDETRLTTFDYSGTADFRLLHGRLGAAVSLGLQYYNRWLRLADLDGEGLATPTLRTIGAAAVTTSYEDIVENTTVGTYVQQQLNWQQRIFLTGAIRADDNSAFGANFDAAIYPKLSATWVIHEEPFWNLDFINQFRLRGAWGAAGQQPDVFAAARLYEARSGPGDQPILTPSEYGNPDLAPERGEEFELGFDASLLNDRIGLTFTHYRRTTEDVIVATPLAESLGFPSDQLVNIGETRNWGTEVELSAQLLAQDPVRWDLSVSFATMENEITDLGSVDQIPVRRGRLHVEGYPLASVFSQRVVSADFVSGESGPVTNVMCDGGTGTDGRSIGGGPVPCKDAPFLYWGRAEPSWTASMASMLTLFRNWQLYASIDVRGGHIQFHDALGAKHTTFTNTRCANVQDDPICMGQRAINRAPLGLFDGSFARLRELSLNYTFPDQLAQRFGVRAASVAFGWRNVGLLWFPGKYAGEIAGVQDRDRIADPEMNAPSEQFGGEVVTGMPPLSQATVTLKVSF
ncbi:MAG: SusC/RagA family TonB-linked outer membrane protein [Gemmatimonas sp.]|nr:SusC/RagA family TonB-linked outer membrane protein [Gemmatimonas sp.]